MTAVNNPSGGKLERIFVGRKTERDTIKAVLNSVIQSGGAPTPVIVDWMDEEEDDNTTIGRYPIAYTR